MHHPALVAELLDLHGHLVGQLIAKLAHDLFAHQLGRQESLALVGDLILGEEVHTLRQVLGHFDLELRNIGAVLGGDRHDGGKVPARADRLEPRQELGLVLQAIDLVDGQNHRRVDMLEALQNDLILIAPASTVDDEHHTVDIAQRLHGRLIHEAVDRLVAILGHDMDAGRVDIDELGLLLGLDAHHLMAGRLGPPRGDRHLLAEDTVHQRGLADVGAADDGHETTGLGHDRTPLGSSCFRATSAACCSA